MGRFDELKGKIIRYASDVTVSFEENGDTFVIGVGAENLKKTDEELKTIGLQLFDAGKTSRANPPPPTYQELRTKEYLAKGLTTDKLVIALWEKVVEGRPEVADLIQAERVLIKAKYPK